MVIRGNAVVAHGNATVFHGHAMVVHGHSMPIPWECQGNAMGYPTSLMYGRECVAWFCFRAAEADLPAPSTSLC